MNHNRYFLCFLICVGMIYYVAPRLKLGNEGIEGAFSGFWLMFALIVIVGNLSALFSTTKKRKNVFNSGKKSKSKKNIRSFHG